MCFRNFLTEFENNYSIITDEKFIDIVKKANLTAYRQKDFTPNFIFEIVKDIDGYSYAREILTQRLFPLIDNEQTKENVRYDYNNDNKIDKIFTYENPKFAKINYAFYYFQTATKNEVNEYIAKNNKKYKIAKHIKSITRYYNENSFKEKIILKEDIELKKELNITDIDSLVEMILKSKDDYTIIDQRIILKKLSLLYVLIIKDNINNIDSSNLENSYFKENIKSIILSINELSENNIIEEASLDFSKLYSIEETLEIIKNINFKGKDIKKLIK